MKKSDKFLSTVQCKYGKSLIRISVTPARGKPYIILALISTATAKMREFWGRKGVIRDNWIIED